MWAFLGPYTGPTHKRCHLSVTWEGRGPFVSRHGYLTSNQVGHGSFQKVWGPQYRPQVVGLLS